MTDGSMQTFLPPGAGKLVNLGGIGVHFKLYGEETGGLLAIVEHPLEPGTLVPPHMHAREDEFSYVLEGHFGVRIGERVLEAGPGSYVFKPRNIPHTFWNAGSTSARLIELIAPAGFEHFFVEMATLFPVGGLPDLEQVVSLGQRYGLTLGPDAWVPELAARYHLTLFGR